MSTTQIKSKTFRKRSLKQTKVHVNLHDFSQKGRWRRCFYAVSRASNRLCAVSEGPWHSEHQGCGNRKLGKPRTSWSERLRTALFRSKSAPRSYFLALPQALEHLQTMDLAVGPQELHLALRASRRSRDLADQVHITYRTHGITGIIYIDDVIYNNIIYMYNIFSIRYSVRII